jgi:hypothetical protein
MICRFGLQILVFGGTDEPPAAGELDQILFSFAGAFAATILPTTMMGWEYCRRC